MIPAMMTDVVRLLKHDRELVRKKAVMVLHRMNQLDADVSLDLLRSNAWRLPTYMLHPSDAYCRVDVKEYTDSIWLGLQCLGWCREFLTVSFDEQSSHLGQHPP